ncbi:hypothetical protein EMEDMD4_790237 [Sinorhizobium medicae]|uniref:Uncharacterized protein n=1 Tax=Sinorhizobium medicae TaxID=110321 RepID=A0A508XAJ7_9HYPH|nr:hypothetical protein EMEDMD4_790237 [Sinorhizobium medicae]
MPMPLPTFVWVQAHDDERWTIPLADFETLLDDLQLFDCAPSAANVTRDDFNAPILVRHKLVLEPALAFLLMPTVRSKWGAAH